MPIDETENEEKMKCQATFADANVVTIKAIMTQYEKTTFKIVVTFRETLIKTEEERIALAKSS